MGNFHVRNTVYTIDMTYLVNLRVKSLQLHIQTPMDQAFQIWSPIL